MRFQDHFAVWDKLIPAQQQKMTEGTALHTVKKGEVIHSGAVCTGVILVRSGQLRAYYLSDEGREITSTACSIWTCACFPRRVWCVPSSLI